MVVVAVANLDPVVTLTGPSPVAEGSTHTYSYTTSDDGTETFARDAQSCDGGALSGATFSTATGAGSFDCTYADGPSSHNPSVTISDGDGGSDSDSLAVTVNNVAPSIAISGAANVNEGSSYSLTLGAVTDPGTDTVTSYVVHWGDGSSSTYSTDGDQEPHLRRRRQQLRRHSRPGRRGRHLPRRGKRPLGARQQRRPDGRDQRRGQRRRGLALQPDPGRGHRPGQRHRLELDRPLGRRQLASTYSTDGD